MGRMLRITRDHGWPLHDSAATRQMEADAGASAGPHALMQRAGLAVVRLASAVAPHARTVWAVCGPGNNGGDGLEAAMHLHHQGRHVLVRWLGDAGRMPEDAAQSLQRARAAGVVFSDQSPADLTPQDLCIDALLGLGSNRPCSGAIATSIADIHRCAATVLAVDLPSGLDADTGTGVNAVRAHHTLSLLTLKPGLFTGDGQDRAGHVWLDDLQAQAHAPAPNAWLAGAPPTTVRLHASHKGTYGDVAVVGGAPGMRGAALLAGAAALHAGAGRVYLSLVGKDGGELAAWQPELMARPFAALPLASLTVACGCGGGTHVAQALPRILEEAASLVLDADALNAVAGDLRLQALLRARSLPTVLTPHPLEAARLLGCSTGQIQGDRLAAAGEIAERFRAVVILKGSGTVIATPGRLTCINPTGSARLATAGTGDVLAGMVAAALAARAPAFDAACAAVYRHGAAADSWPPDRPLTAGDLARAVR